MRFFLLTGSQHNAKVTFLARLEVNAGAPMSESHVAENSHIAILPTERNAKRIVRIGPQLLFFQGEGGVITKEHLQRTIFLRNVFNARPGIEPFAIICKKEKFKLVCGTQQN